MRIRDSLRYNELNHIAQFDEYQLIDNEWVYIVYIEYTYDANGNKTSRSNYNSGGTSTFTLGGVYNYFYENNETHWELLINGDDLIEIGTLTYNNEGQLTQKVGQSIWFGGAPENSWKIDYEYNSDGTVNFSKQYFWDNQSWNLSNSQWFYYDEDKNCIKWEYKIGNSVINRSEYLYNLDVSQENIILPINPEDGLDGENLVEMQNMVIRKQWYTTDAVSGELVYVCDYIYTYETVPVLGVPSYEEAADNITIFPSPANEVVTVLTKNLFINNLEVLDAMGKKVLDISNPNQRESKIDVSNLNSRVYFIRVSTTKGPVTQKIIVQ